MERRKGAISTSKGKGATTKLKKPVTKKSDKDTGKGVIKNTVRKPRKPTKKVVKYSKKFKLAEKTIKLDMRIEEPIKAIEARKKKKLNKPRVIKTVVSLIVIILGIFIGALVINGKGLAYQDYQMTKTVRGIVDGDIKDTYITKDVIGISDKDYYNRYVAVRYKDETGITYYYAVSKDKKSIKQLCYRDSSYKNVEIDIKKQTLHSETICYI